MRPVHRGVLLVLGALLATGCARSRFDNLVRTGRFAEAVATFESDSALQRSPQAVLQAAALHAAADLETWNPERAAVLFAQARAVGARLTPADARLEGVLARLAAELASREIRADSLRRTIAQLGREIDADRMERDTLRALLREHGEERALLQRLIERLETDLREREEQLQLLRTELDRLKAIDLRIPPPVIPPPWY